MTNTIEYNDKWQIKCCGYQDEYIVQPGTLLKERVSVYKQQKYIYILYIQTTQTRNCGKWK